MVKRLIQNPEVIQGVDIYKNAFRVLRPMAATNQFHNPSFERTVLPATGVGAGATLTRVTGTDTSGIGYQRRGSFGAKLVSAAGGASGMQYVTEASIGIGYHTFSVDLRGVPGRYYKLYCATGIPAESEAFMAPGYWTRIYYTFRTTAAGALTMQLRPFPNSPVVAETIYTDGWMLTDGIEQHSYTDGDIIGYVEGSYGWNGIVHYSQSYRAYYATHGGYIADFNNAGFDISSVIGLGYENVDSTFSQVSTGGGIYENTRPTTRAYSLAGALRRGKTFREMNQARAKVTEFVRYDQTKYKQPVTLKYRPTDECGDPIGVETRLDSVYTGGMTGEIVNPSQDRFGINFEMPDPYIKEDGDIGVELPYFHPDTFEYCAKNSLDIWDTLNGGADGAVYVIRYNPVNNLYYFGGAFANIGGVAASRIASYNPLTDTFAALGAGADNTVYDIQIANNGNVFLCGLFANFAGVAAPNVAKWLLSGGVGKAVGVGPGATAYKLALLVSATNTTQIYASTIINTGGFNYNLVRTADEFTAVWSTELTGALTGACSMSHVYASKTGVIYAAYSYVNGINYQTDIRRRTAVATWTTIGSFRLAGVGVGVADMTFDDSGNLYYGSDYTYCITTATSIAAIARWNGTTWQSVGGGITPIGNVVYGLDWKKGKLYAVGNFTAAGGYTLVSDGIAAFDGSVWGDFVFITKNFTVAANWRAICVSDVGYGMTYYLGSSNINTAAGTSSFMTPASTTVTATQDNLYPVLEVKGPGDIKLFANSTHELSFIGNVNGIGFLEAVQVIFKLNDFSIISDTRGIATYQAAANSSFDVRLMTGANALTLFLTNYVYFECQTADAGKLSGFNQITGITSFNSNYGKVNIAAVAVGGGFYRIDIYFVNVLGASTLIGHTANYNAIGWKAIIPDGGSGLGGQIYVAVVSTVDVRYAFVYYAIAKVKWVNKFPSLDKIVTPEA